MQPDLDSRIVGAQIGRPARGRSLVVLRCHLQMPVVVKMHPRLDTGEPFPTTYWLTCPLAHRRVARLEAKGGVRDADQRMATDSDFAKEVQAAHARYETDRDAMLDDDDDAMLTPAPSGGVGGSRGGVKCLHAHLADRLAGNQNIVGEDTARKVLPLNCEMACVVKRDGRVEANVEWSEPVEVSDSGGVVGVLDPSKLGRSFRRAPRGLVDSSAPESASVSAPANRVTWTVIGLCAIAVLFMSTQLIPDPSGHGTHQQLGLPPCGFSLLIGWPCPGCGLTTSFTNMVRGQASAAFNANPFGVLLFLTTVFSIPLAVAGAFGNLGVMKTLVRYRLDQWAIVLAAAALLSWGWQLGRTYFGA